MFLGDERMRQVIIGEMESYNGDCEIEDAAKLFERGWSILEIAQSMDAPIRNVIDALRHYISADPEEIEQALKYAEYEDYVEEDSKPADDDSE